MVMPPDFDNEPTDRVTLRSRLLPCLADGSERKR